jgi:hypothetical protein
MKEKIEVGDTVRIKENHPYTLIAKGTCGTQSGLSRPPSKTNAKERMGAI